jgi:hypothetical protein
LSREERIAIRKGEQRAAAEVLGVREVVFLREPDGLLEPALELRRKIVGEIRRFQPDTVMCWDPTLWRINDTMVNHPDYRAAAQAKVDAVLMDEPFAALDALTRASMQTLLLQVWGAMPQTILFITHDVDEALILSERVYVMTSGPGSLLAEVAVELPRPRTLEVMATAEYLALQTKANRPAGAGEFGGETLAVNSGLSAGNRNRQHF